jgi:hypothetical protein
MDIQWMMVHWWVLVHCGRVKCILPGSGGQNLMPQSAGKTKEKKKSF